MNDFYQIVIMAISGILFFSCLTWAINAKQNKKKAILTFAATISAIACMEMIARQLTSNSKDIAYVFILISEIIVGILGTLTSLILFLIKDNKSK